MILTLTPNPSVDRTIALDALLRGEVQRATSTRMEPGGKGIIVARVLARNDVPTTAVYPSGGGFGRMMADLLDDLGLPVVAVPIAEAIRANVTLVEPDGTTTKINEQGPHLSPAEAEALLGAVDAAYDGSVTWVVGSGTLAPGLDPSFYAELVRRVHLRGAKVALDTSGAPLAAAVPAGPDLVKPNRIELGELVGHDLPTLADVVAAARDLVTGGIPTVLVSLGRDGAVVITAVRVVHASARVARPLSTVGAGDCTLAGYLIASDRGWSPDECLAQAVAFGSAAVALPGSEVPNQTQVAAISVDLDTTPDLTRSLTD